MSLRITHAERTPDDISRLLSRHPNNSGVKGGRRGSAGSRAIWPFNYWSSDFDDAETIAHRITDIARFVEKNEDTLRVLLKSGGKAHIFVFIGVERKEVGFTLDEASLAVFGRVGVGLDFDIFPPMPKAKAKAK